MPFAFLELKAAAYTTGAIDWLWAEILELGVVNHVALYVTDNAQPSMLAQQTHWQGVLVRAFKVQRFADMRVLVLLACSHVYLCCLCMTFWLLWVVMQ